MNMENDMINDISYVGTTYEITWSDYGDEKKYWLLFEENCTWLINKEAKWLGRKIKLEI